MSINAKLDVTDAKGEPYNPIIESMESGDCEVDAKFAGYVCTKVLTSQSVYNAGYDSTWDGRLSDLTGLD